MKHTAIALAFVLVGIFTPVVSKPIYEAEALKKGYYIVVAAYKRGFEKYAQAYSANLNERGLHTQYGYDESRKLYYVYLDFYSDFNESISQMLKTRKESGFEQAWVRIIKQDGAEVAKVEDTPEVKKDPVIKPEPAKEEVIKPVLVKEQKEEVKKEEVKEEVVSNKPVLEEVKEPAEEKNEEPKKDENAPLLKDGKVLFNLYNPTNGQMLQGEVEIIDTDRSQLVKKVKSNEVIEMPKPRSNSGKVTLIGTAFGFRKIQHDIQLADLKQENAPDFIEWEKDHYIINFDLARLHKGDIETLYNVYFYNDAAIMMPESKYELNRLLDMMKENPDYRISLHGHTNGNGRGKIISMGPSKNFFELTGDVVTGSGSAKELSGARGETIKQWLVASGINADRVETKAWGGNRMLHDKNSAHARRNVRVEVEILED